MDPEVGELIDSDSGSEGLSNLEEENNGNEDIDSQASVDLEEAVAYNSRAKGRMKRFALFTYISRLFINQDLTSLLFIQIHIHRRSTFESVAGTKRFRSKAGTLTSKKDIQFTTGSFSKWKIGSKQVIRTRSKGKGFEKDDKARHRILDRIFLYQRISWQWKKGTRTSEFHLVVIKSRFY